MFGFIRPEIIRNSFEVADKFGMAKIQQTFSISEADIVANITQEKGKADLCVFLVNSPGMAWGDERWYITENDAEIGRAHV